MMYVYASLSYSMDRCISRDPNFRCQYFRVFYTASSLSAYIYILSLVICFHFLSKVLPVTPENVQDYLLESFWKATENVCCWSCCINSSWNISPICYFDVIIFSLLSYNYYYYAVRRLTRMTVLCFRLNDCP